MCGTAVRWSSSTGIRPRLSASSPAFSSSSASVAPWRPIAYSTVSEMSSLPEARRTFGPRASPSSSTAATLSCSRNVTFARRSRYWNASPISPSRNGSTRSRLSTTVTFVPSAPNIEAYSTPITPAPTTVMVRGTRWSSFSRPSESITVRSSNSTAAGRAGRCRQAMMIRRARMGSSSPSTRTVLASSNRAWPGSRPTRLRRNCSRTTAVSAATTRAVRSISCSSARCSHSSTRVGSGTSSGRWASSSSTASRRVLEGIVPVWIETPPSRSRRSTTATRLPSLAAWMAAFCPLGPEPITRRSRSTLMQRTL